MSQQIVSTWDGVQNTNSWVHDGDVERSAVDIVELASSVAGYSAGAQAAADAASGYADTASAAVASIGTAATDAVAAVQSAGNAEINDLYSAADAETSAMVAVGSSWINTLTSSGGIVTSAVGDAGAAQILAVTSAGGAQVSLVSAAGGSAIGDLAAVTAAQSAALVSAGGYQAGLVASAGTATIALVQAEGATQTAAISASVASQVNIATSAAIVATSAADIASGAANAIVSAGTSQVSLINAAGTAQITSVGSAGGTQVSLVNSAGATQSAIVVSAGSAASALVVSTGNTQSAALVSAGAVQSAAVVSAGGLQVGLVQSAGAAEIEAITSAASDYAKKNGNYPDMTVGNAEQIVSEDYLTDTAPYVFRTAGGNVDIGDREYDELVGGTIAWNQNIPAPYTTEDWSFGATSEGVLVYTAASMWGNTQALKGNYPIRGHVYIIAGDFYFDVLPSDQYRFDVGNSAYTSSLNINLHEKVTQASTWTHVVKLNKYVLNDAAVINKRAYCIDYAASNWVTLKAKNMVLFDLTAMFGTAIADYIYALEQANAGAGMAWFWAHFPKGYYAFDLGSLQSVQAASHDMVGFNQWDEETRLGYYSNQGVYVSHSNTLCNVNPISVFPNTQYYVKSAVYTLSFFCYDADMNYLGVLLYQKQNEVITTPANCYYLNFGNSYNAGTSFTKGDICINLSWSGYRNGEYEPYQKNSYPLDSTLTLRGIPKLDASNNLVYDGDTYEADGTVTRRYGVHVFAGNESFTKIATQTEGWNMFAYAPSPAAVFTSVVIDFVSDVGDAILSANIDLSNITKPLVTHYGAGFRFILNAADEAGARTALTGKTLVYELATPTTETADAYQTPQIVSDFGTEQYVDAAVAAGTRDVAIPVGHDTKYTQNLRDKLRRLPNMPDADGVYNVLYTGRQCEFIAATDAASDATPQPLGVAAAGTDTDYARADHVHERPVEIDIDRKKLDNVLSLMNGALSTQNTDATSAYAKTVPAKAQPYAAVQEIGGKTVVWNQLVDDLTAFSKSYVSITKSGTDYVCKPTSTAYNAVNFYSSILTSGHKYFISVSVKRNTTTENSVVCAITPGLNSPGTALTQGQFVTVQGVVTASSATLNTYFSYASASDVATTDEFTVRDYVVTDLTLLYGAGNEPSTVDEFQAMFPTINPAYNAGSLISAVVTGVVSKDAEDATLSTLPIPAAVQALPGYGWSAGSVCNEVDWERKVYVQRVASVDLGTLSWGKYDDGTTHSRFSSGVLSGVKLPADNYTTSNILCVNFVSGTFENIYGHTIDNCITIATTGSVVIYASTKMSMTGTEFKADINGVTLYYELATPVETDISDLLSDDNLIEVEPGGSISFPSQLGDDYRLPVPSDVEYTIDLAPDTPSADGTYTLQCVVADGVATYSWVSA